MSPEFESLQILPAGKEEIEKTEMLNLERQTLLDKTLLDKKDNNEFTKEDEARLNILTEKVKKLIPSVTEEDYKRIKEFIEKFEKMDDEVNDIIKDLGIKIK